MLGQIAAWPWKAGNRSHPAGPDGWRPELSRRKFLQIAYRVHTPEAWSTFWGECRDFASGIWNPEVEGLEVIATDASITFRPLLIYI